MLTPNVTHDVCIWLFVPDTMIYSTLIIRVLYNYGCNGYISGARAWGKYIVRYHKIRPSPSELALYNDRCNGCPLYFLIMGDLSSCVPDNVI